MSPRERQVFEELRGACQAIIRDWEHNLSHAAQMCQAAVDAAADLDAAKDTVTARAWSRGERNVGIPADEIRLEFYRGLLEDDDGSLRESVRRKLRRLATEIFDHVPGGVHFEDECPDCEGPLVKGKCPNVNCPSNAAEAV